MQQQLHAADAVGERVVDLDDERGPAAVHALDEGRFPHRAHGIEAGGAELPCQFQHGVEGGGHRCLDPPDVPGQVEVGVDHPLGRRQPQRGLHHLLPEHRHRPGKPLETVPHVLEGRCAVDRRTTATGILNNGSRSIVQENESVSRM